MADEPTLRAKIDATDYPIVRVEIPLRVRSLSSRGMKGDEIINLEEELPRIFLGKVFTIIEED